MPWAISSGGNLPTESGKFIHAYLMRARAKPLSLLAVLDCQSFTSPFISRTKSVNSSANPLSTFANSFIGPSESLSLAIAKITETTAALPVKFNNTSPTSIARFADICDCTFCIAICWLASTQSGDNSSIALANS